MTLKRGPKAGDRDGKQRGSKEQGDAGARPRRPASTKPKRIKGSAVRGVQKKTAAEVRAELDGKPRPVPVSDGRPAPRHGGPRPASRDTHSRGDSPRAPRDSKPSARDAQRPSRDSKPSENPATRGPRAVKPSENDTARGPRAVKPSENDTARGPRTVQRSKNDDATPPRDGKPSPRTQRRETPTDGSRGNTVGERKRAASKMAPQPRPAPIPKPLLNSTSDPKPVVKRERTTEPQPRRSGKIGILGRPNVGKSTLLNALLGSRVAITSHHPQTTRDRIAGIVVRDDTQFVFLDTPGIHQARTKLGQRMNGFARDVGVEADVVLFVTDLAKTPTETLREIDRELIPLLPNGKPVLLLINKIDKLEKMEELLPILAGHAEAYPWATIVPVSAYRKDGLENILSSIEKFLPEQDFLYPEDDISDKPIRFFVAEFVREAILRRTREEVPHGVAVTIDAFDEAPRVPRIDLTVHVDKDSHKPIILGARGTALQAIGTRARARVEEMLGRQVHLQIHVRVTPGWYENEARLAEFGYTAGSDTRNGD